MSVSAPRRTLPLQTVTEALFRWMASVGHASWDPYDGLTSPVLRPLFAWRLPARISLQIVKRSPLNLRPGLGIAQRVYTKTLSDLLSASVLLHRFDRDPAALERARRFAARLRTRALTSPCGCSWGMDVPYVSRFTAATPTTPNLFQTVNVALAFLDLYEVSGDDGDLQPALAVVEWMQKGLGTLDADDARLVWRYYPNEEAVVYNVNALAAALLTRLAAATQSDELASLGRRTLEFVVSEQNPDGSWYYARGPRGRWIDGFHSAYVLEALYESSRRIANTRADQALDRGMRFFRARLLEPSGLPRYKHDRLYPIDAQNCAQAIQLLAKLGQRDPVQLQLARNAYRETARSLLVWRHSGEAAHAYFRMQRGRWLRNDLAAIRWGVAPMLLALMHLRAAEARAVGES